MDLNLLLDFGQGAFFDDRFDGWQQEFSSNAQRSSDYDHFRVKYVEQVRHAQTKRRASFAQRRQGFSVAYLRVPRLFQELRIARGDASYTRRLAQLAKVDVVLLDDWGLNPLDQPARSDLLEILDDRVGARSTILTSQLPLDQWYASLNDPTLADAILDRLIHAAHKLVLKGESLRKKDKP